MADDPNDISIPFSMTIELPAPARSGMIARRAGTHPPGSHPGPPPGARPPMPSMRPGAHPAVPPAALMAGAAAAVPALGAEALVTVVVDGVATAVSILLLPEVLAAVGAVAAVTIIAAGIRHRFNTPKAAAAWARLAAPQTPTIESLPIPNPRPALPPTTVDVPAHTGNDQPPVRLPALPLPGATITVPPVLRGREITEPGPRS